MSIHISLFTVFLLFILSGCDGNNPPSVVPLTDVQSVSVDASNLTFDTIKNKNKILARIRTDLSLATSGSSGTTISWESNNTNYINSNGIVIRPSYTEGSQNISLAATIIKGEESTTKLFSLTLEPGLPLLVIQIEFINHQFTSTTQVWSDKIFGTEQSEVNHYFDSVSYNSFNVVKARDEDSANGGTPNDGIITVYLNENHPGDIDAFVTRIVEAATLADPYIDYAQYDDNNDSFIQIHELQIMFLVAGGSSSTGMVPGIWAHAWSLFGQDGANPPVLDGVSLMSFAGGENYSRFAEHQFDDTRDSTIGVIVHELAHSIFELPDLYDYDGSSQGIGYFGLMGVGAWAYSPGELDGQRPTHMSGWSKIKAGFITPIDINSTQTNVTLWGASRSDYNLIKLSTINPLEYFLIENRDASGYDLGLYRLNYTSYLGGLAIWHIDEGQPDNRDDTHRIVSLEKADNESDINSSYGNETSLYYLENNTHFGDATLPSSVAYDGNSTDIEITNISQRGDGMTLDITP